VSILKKIVSLLLILIIIASGCLVKQPAEVRFEIDKKIVQTGETFHLIVTINNTGKVAFIKMEDLIELPEGFTILQSPSFPSPLKVGDVTELVWVIKAPSTPGVYTIKVPLKFIDELNRPWGFYQEFTISVVKKGTPPQYYGKLEASLNLPQKSSGGSILNVTLTLKNSGNAPIEIKEISLKLLEGLVVLNQPQLPRSIGPNMNYVITYKVKASYQYISGYITVIIDYIENNKEKRRIESQFLEITWRPWLKPKDVLKEAYGDKYVWIENEYLVDGYWSSKFNSTSFVNLNSLRDYSLPLVLSSKSEFEAANIIYNWIKENYKLGDVTITLDPLRIIEQRKISYAESQILFTAMMRSISVPSRIVTLYNGSDCTLRPISEFYYENSWYIVDFENNFIGSRDDYIVTPYFPKIYQLITKENYRIVAQAPEDLEGHEHLELTPDYLANLKDRLKSKVEKKFNPTLRPKFTKMLADMSENEQIFTLFLFASAPENELNELFSKYDPKEISKGTKTLYEFYKDKEWPENFIKYWYILRGVYK
jgi:hypothetical protein